MGKYTLEIREIVENNVVLFDFAYPIFDEHYRNILEEKITRHFYFREIGFETVGKFKYYLKTKLNEIMPIYNKIYETSLLELRILDNYEVTETYVKEGSNTATQNNDGTTNNKKLFSDTPMGVIDLKTTDHLTEITDDTVTDDTTISTVASDNENWTRIMKGNIGVQTDSDAVVNFRKGLLNVDLEIMRELNELFMGVY